MKRSKTGNVAIDMISACLKHYSKTKVKVKTIHLNHKYFEIFRRFIENETDATVIDTVWFKDVTVKRGSVLQVSQLEINLPDAK